MKSIAKVNGKPIKFSLFEAKLDEFIRDLQEDEDEKDKKMTDIELYEIKSEVVDSMIDNELLVQYAEKNKISVSPAEVKNEFDKVLEFYQSREEFEKGIRDLGISNDDIMEDIKNNLLIQKVIDKEITPSAEVLDDKALLAFYDEHLESLDAGPAVHAKHIFIKVDDFDNKSEADSAKKRIDEVYKKLVDGKPFDELAKEFSDCASAERGGDLGIITYDDIDEDFADIIFPLKKGNYSEPFATDAGFHIALAVDNFAKYTPPFEQIKSSLKEYLEEMVEDDAIDTFLEKLRDEAEIEISEY